MPYETIPELSDGQVLSASYLNTLSANQEFLYSQGNQANIPFNAFRIVAADFDSDDAVWYIRHRLQYLHFSVQTHAGGAPEYVRIFYNTILVAQEENPGAGYSGSVDLTDFSTLPGLIGPWATSTSYEDDSGGDVVSHNDAYYRCIDDHTSGSTTEPGVGEDWETVWQLITPPTVGQIYELYVVVKYENPNESTVEYLFELDSASL